MKLQVVQLKARHFSDLCAHMRQADREELRAASAESAEDVLLRGIAESVYVRVAEAPWPGRMVGRTAMIWGVCPLLGVSKSTGVPWALGTDAIEEHRKDFLRISRLELKVMLAFFPTLVNLVHARNERAVRWLRWLGATIDPAVSWGLAGEKFMPFSFRREEKQPCATL